MSETAATEKRNEHREGVAYTLQRNARRDCYKCGQTPKAGQVIVYIRDVTGQLRIWHLDCWANRKAGK